MDLIFDIFEAQYVIFFLAGFAMFVAGIAIIIHEKNIKRRSTKIQGYISGVAKKDKFYYLVTTFTDPNGKEQEFTGRVGSGAVPNKNKIGKPITVLYIDGEKPKIDGKAMYILGAILIIMGIVFAGIYLINFDFNWISILFSIGIVLFIGVKIMQKASKIKSIKNAKSFSGAISSIIKESKKSIKDKKPEPYEKIDHNQLKQEKKKQQAPKWLAIPLGLISIGLFIGGYYSYNNQAEFLETAYMVEGKVIDFKESRSTTDGSTSYTYAPIINFKVGARKFTFTDSMGSSHPSENVGDIVPVLYNRNNPNDAQMDKGWLNWILPIILLTLAPIILYASIRIHRNKIRC